MDVTTAAVMGHSFGGTTTIQTLSEDSRFRYKCLGIYTSVILYVRCSNN